MSGFFPRAASNGRDAYLVDGLRVGDGVGVLDHRHGLAGQDTLVDTEGGREDGDQAQISGDLVAH